MTPRQASNGEFIISFWTLRKALGYLAIAMPIVVRVGAYAFEGIPSSDSISAYYYTSMRDVFVGTLFAIGVFLFFYRGQDPVDDVLTNVAGAAAVGIGLLPMDPAYHSVILARFPELANPGCYINHGPLGYHFVAVSIFFGLISYITIFRFTKPTQARITRQKRSRNKVYVVCGVTMIASFIVIGVLKLRVPSASIFWPETIAIVAFAVAWLTKGQAILKDKPELEATLTV